MSAETISLSPPQNLSIPGPLHSLGAPALSFRNEPSLVLQDPIFSHSFASSVRRVPRNCERWNVTVPDKPMIPERRAVVCSCSSPTIPNTFQRNSLKNPHNFNRCCVVKSIHPGPFHRSSFRGSFCLPLAKKMLGQYSTFGTFINQQGRELIRSGCSWWGCAAPSIANDRK